jgi:monoamine oxidase
MEEPEILIIGAGIAGLVAARELARAGLSVLILEARDRIGGRILTVSSQPGNVPVELGAEFIHGAENDAWPLIREARLRTHAVPDRHWRPAGAELKKSPGFWDKIGEAIGRINPHAPDQDVQSFLDEAWSLDSTTKKLAKDFVEGFHAAPARRMSVHALVLAEAAAEKERGTKSYRVANGYAALVSWLERELAELKVEIHRNVIARAVRWHAGDVEVVAQTPSGQEVFHASRALITLPLGVLQQTGPGGLDFNPRVPGKERAIQALGMGHVTKLTLRFTSRFWPVSNFGFIHADDRHFPTWWSDERGHILTGWAGGPRAEQLSACTPEMLVEFGLAALERLFKTDPGQMRRVLAGSYSHDWATDPFSRGAYSYTPVGTRPMVARLAAPVAGTLFFAGEATNTDGDQGTVHGTITTANRAVAEILQSTRVGSSAREELATK